MTITRRKPPDSRQELKIITGLIVDDEFCKTIIPILKDKPNLFLIPYAETVSGWIVDYFDSYGQKAPVKYMQDIFLDKKNSLDNDMAELIKDFLAMLSSEYEEQEGKFNFEYEIDKTWKYLTGRQIEENQNSVRDAIKRKDIEEAQKLIQDFEPITLTNPDEQGFTAKELQDMEIPEIQWVIEDVIPQGLTLFAGKPKVGKSYFVLNAAIDLAFGREAFDSIPTVPARTLYLALEDTEVSLKDRLNKIIRDNEWPDKLQIFPMGTWPRADQGGFQKLEKWMEEYPDTKLIIIDTLEKFKKPQKTPGYHYSSDYQALAPLQEFAGKHGISLVIVHHTRKTKADDIFDEIGGTTGLTGAADNLAVMGRISTGKADRVFAFRGRHIGEGETAYKFENFRFLLMGDAVKYKHSEQRQTIIEYLEQANRVVERKELMDAIGDKVGKGVDVLLNKLVDNGDIEKPGYGKYAPAGYKHEKAVVHMRDVINRKRRRKVS